MNAFRSHLARALLVPFVAATLALPTLAQQPPATAPAAPAAAKSFSQQDLDQLLAPIALYPDALVAQVLMASTFPLEVVEAARWSKANPAVKDKALEDAMQKQSWDPAVKSLTSVPQVLALMNDKLDWTQKVGNAFVAQQEDMLKTVQGLRAKANAAGNLKSTNEQKVKTEQEGSQTIYIIESAKPEVVYVPTYNPATVYGAWPYPAPPYSMYPPAYVYPPGVAFATGVIVGAAIWGNANWHGNNVNVNVNQYNSYNKTNISNANVQQQYNKKQVQGAAQAQGVSKSSMQAQAQGANRSSMQAQAQTQGASRSSMQGQAQGASASSRAGSGGFSGAGTGSGAATREASARGGASRGGGGGGGGGRRR